MRSTNSARQAVRSAVSLLGVLSAAGRVCRGPRFQDTRGEGPRQLERQGRPADLAPRSRPTAAGGRRSTTRCSISWSSSPTGRTSRCRSPASGSSRPAPSSASRPASSFPRRRSSRPAQPRWGSANQHATALGLSRPSSDYQVGFDAAWELDFWGKYRRGVEADAAGLLASVADYDSALVSLTAEVARTYALIRTFEVLIAQAQDNVKLQEEALRIAESRFRNGATSELDVTQADDPAGEHAGLDPAAADQPAAGAKRAEHAARPAAGHRRRAAGRAQGDPERAREGGRQRAGRDAAAAPRHPQRRALRRRAVRPHRRRQGRALSELLALRHRSALQASTAGSDVAQPLLRPTASSTRVGPQINWPFFNYGRIRTACACRTRGSSSCSSTTATPCSRPRRKWKTRWPGS